MCNKLGSHALSGLLKPLGAADLLDFGNRARDTLQASRLLDLALQTVVRSVLQRKPGFSWPEACGWHSNGHFCDI